MTSFYYYDQNPSGFFAFLCKLGLLLTSLGFPIKFLKLKEKRKGSWSQSLNGTIVQKQITEI